MTYCPESNSHIKSEVKVQLNLTKYAIKSDIKNKQMLIKQNFLNRLI